jgi:lipopolysaccharide transport system permease protein
VLAWSFFAGSLPAGVTSIVDNASLTDKLWFPRAILAIVPCVSGLVGLGLSMTILLVGAPILGAGLGVRALLLIPACGLLVALTMSLGMLLASLQVYFRDVRFIATAALTVWLYVTPVMYPPSAVGEVGPWLDFNPMTGVISMFHIAIVGSHDPAGRAIVVSLVFTAATALAAMEVQRRHDRLFVDLL